ncbi:hypothetical protein ACFFGH_12605 [Lysobacter korlensis]|uniref:Uncharacterized protein n=1 Tax=Lysobacter korlensis TaxID=553636 RepID=A0ABV6RRW3_9GAMM
MAQLLDPEQWGRGQQPRSGSDEPIDSRPPGPRRSASSSAPTLSVPPASAAEQSWDPFADEPGAAAAPPQPPRRTPPPPTKPPRRESRLPLILAIVLVALALVAGGVWAAASGLLPFGGGNGGAAPETPGASAPATDEPQPSETPSTPADPAATPLPASCDELYSDSMRGTIENAGLALNPEWYVSGGDVRLPSEDSQLQELLGTVDRVDCAWVQPEGGGEVGIFTSVSQLTTDQAAAANARLIELGYGAIEELGGVRYVTETTGEGNTLGESHFIRDGLWFGTLWINFGPAGYTADMVTQVLG